MEAGIIALRCNAIGLGCGSCVAQRRWIHVGAERTLLGMVSAGEDEMSSPEQVHDNVEDTGSDDEEETGRCMECCMTCSFLKAACSELCRLFCWPPVPSRIASKLAFVPPSPHYGALTTTQP